MDFTFKFHMTWPFTEALELLASLKPCISGLEALELLASLKPCISCLQIRTLMSTYMDDFIWFAWQVNNWQQLLVMKGRQTSLRPSHLQPFASQSTCCQICHLLEQFAWHFWVKMLYFKSFLWWNIIIDICPRSTASLGAPRKPVDSVSLWSGKPKG